MGDVKVKIGFWRGAPDAVDPLPWPVEGSFTGDHEAFTARLERLPIRIVERYKGSSECRLCGMRNGSHDVRWGRFLFPSGYIHYITEHKVQPDPAFYDAVMAAVLLNED